MAISPSNWYRIVCNGQELSFSEKGIAVVELAGLRFCITFWRGEWIAFSFRCPHRGALLSEGRIDEGGNVVCPLHGQRYSLQTGACLSGEEYPLVRWKVEERADGLYMEVKGLISS